MLSWQGGQPSSCLVDPNTLKASPVVSTTLSIPFFDQYKMFAAWSRFFSQCQAHRSGMETKGWGGGGAEREIGQVLMFPKLPQVSWQRCLSHARDEINGVSV